MSLCTARQTPEARVLFFVREWEVRGVRGAMGDENAPAVKPGGTVGAGGFRKKQQPHEIGA